MVVVVMVVVAAGVVAAVVWPEKGMGLSEKTQLLPRIRASG